jgi:methyltransferase (TIGR00027 family)
VTLAAPSRTMLRTASLRAAHQLLDRPPVFVDPVAVDLVPEEDAQLLLETLEPDQVALRALFAVRSRFAEDRLASAAARGVGQYVIIGAGLDTFPWRQPDYAAKMHLFFADRPDTLAWTQAWYQGRGLSQPANLTIVPVDLEDCRLGELLPEFGFDARRPAFCSALGLTPYLTRTAIESMLSFVASLPAGSEIVFSFVPPTEELNREDAQMAMRAAERVAAFGEPWKTRLRPRDLVQQLEALGFSDVFHLTRDTAHVRYFASRQDGLKPPGYEQVICAVI